MRLPPRARPLALALAMVIVAGAHAQSLRKDGLTRSLAPLPVTIRYEKHYGRVTDRVAEICREQIPRIAGEIGLAHMAPIEIIITPDARRYDASLMQEIPSWGVAFAVLEQQRILVDVNRATRAYNSLDEVVPHELSHLLVYQRVPRVRMPIWFLEGLAQWQAQEWSLVDSWALMNSVWSGEAPRLRDVDWYYPSNETRARAAYRVSYAAFTQLFSNGGGFARLPDFLADVDRLRNFNDAFDDFWGFTVDDYDAYLRDDLERKYHSRLLVFQTEPLFGFAAVLFLVVILRHFLRSRKRYREMEE